jgi:hypothetical protein
MADETTQQVTETVTETGKTGFGLGHIGKPTPQWATWVFRIFFYAASLATVIITTDKDIPAETALTIVKYLGYAVMGVHGLSKMVGVDVTQYEQDAKDAFRR